MRFRTKSLLLTLVITLAVLCARAADTWAPGPGWTLVWSDEFTNSTIDTSNWAYDLGGGGWGNNELETYTSTNAYIQNGELVISAIKEGNGSYTSSRMK